MQVHKKMFTTLHCGGYYKIREKKLSQLLILLPLLENIEFHHYIILYEKKVQSLTIDFVSLAGQEKYSFSF